ncbi:alpha/beta hydrolase [Geodermatophilus sp. SYSU D00815]
MPTRRDFLGAGAGLLAAGVLAGCGGRLPGREVSAALLGARPPTGPAPAGPPAEPGTRPLGLRQDRDALLHVPPGLPAGAPVPLVLTLHGAGGDAASGIGLLAGGADERGIVLLAPASEGRTWDAVRSRFGPDAAFVDAALEEAFRLVPVDGARLAVAGFSDGGSYALGLGLANGTVFRRVVAFSPGFLPDAPRRGRPPVFVSHGEGDDVLPVDRAGRRIVRALRDDGYDVTYREFTGGHEVPGAIADEAVAWLG